MAVSEKLRSHGKNIMAISGATAPIRKNTIHCVGILSCACFNKVYPDPYMAAFTNIMARATGFDTTMPSDCP